MAAQLPPLPAIQRLSPRVIRILGDNPGKFTLQGTNTYVIGTGSSRLLIDTGEGSPAWCSRLSQVLKSEGANISQALLTHWHHDHIGGVPDLLAVCPQAKIYKRDPAQDQHTIDDGQEFSSEGATLTALFCPGHTRDHTAFILREEEAIFTGDNVLGHGTAVFEDLVVYLESLAKMRDRITPGKRAYPGHGEIIADGKSKIKEYIQHRQQREQEVLRALANDKGEGLTAMEIVKIIYHDYPESLYGPAEHGILQILKKLETEKKVERCTGGRWKIISKSASVL